MHIMYGITQENEEIFFKRFMLMERFQDRYILDRRTIEPLHSESFSSGSFYAPKRSINTGRYGNIIAVNEAVLHTIENSL